MSDLFLNPAFQSSAVPFVAALLVAVVLGFAGRSWGTARISGLAVLAGFLAANLFIFGLPPLPPVASGQKIAYVALIAAIAGLYLDLTNAAARKRLAAGVIAAAVTVAWLGWRKLAAAPSLSHLAMALVLAGAALVLWRTERANERNSKSADLIDTPLDAFVVLLVVALGLAGVALIGKSASISQNAGSMAAALGGLLILNWPLKPSQRFGLGTVARLVPLLTLTALAAQLALFTRAPVWTLLLLLPAFFAPDIAGRLVSPAHPRAALLRPVVVGLIAALPAALAIAAAYVAAPSGSSGGY